MIMRDSSQGLGFSINLNNADDIGKLKNGEIKQLMDEYSKVHFSDFRSERDDLVLSSFMWVEHGREWDYDVWFYCKRKYRKDYDKKRNETDWLGGKIHRVCSLNKPEDAFRKLLKAIQDSFSFYDKEMSRHRDEWKEKQKEAEERQKEAKEAVEVYCGYMDEGRNANDKYHELMNPKKEKKND